MTEQIKNAISIIEDEKECVQSGVFCDGDCANCELVKEESEIVGAFDVAIRSLNMWEEILQTLEEENIFWTRQAFKHKDDEFAEGRVFGLSKAIDIIKSKLEGVTEND